MPLVTSVDQRFVVEDKLAHELVEEFGSPLFVIDEESLRRRAKRYVDSWIGDVSFASKANTTLAVLKVVFDEGCSIDVASEGELRGALRAGIPAKACRLHGNNKSVQELDFALKAGVGKIVVDCFEEIDRLSALSGWPPLLLRLAPGVAPKTHAKISTGQADTKFGFPMSDAVKATSRCLELGLPLIGYHCHVGSQLLEPDAQVAAARTLSELTHEVQRQTGFVTRFLNVGGGLGVRYTAQDEPVSIEDYCREVHSAFQNALGPDSEIELGMEPGRSIVAESGVTIYTVGVVKTAASGKVYVAVDGGLSDNPRPALYGSRYDLVWHTSSNREQQTVTVSGKHCETDTLFSDVSAPKGLSAGDLVQVLCTGAYNSSMASNYNGFRRPATVLIRTDGTFNLVQRRETWDELHQRDVFPEGL